MKNTVVGMVSARNVEKLGILDARINTTRTIQERACHGSGPFAVGKHRIVVDSVNFNSFSAHPLQKFVGDFVGCSQRSVPFFQRYFILQNGKKRDSENSRNQFSNHWKKY